jgi:GNAT superfamily N-acetyltransferase
MTARPPAGRGSPGGRRRARVAGGVPDEDVVYRISPPVTSEEINHLFDASREEHVWRDFSGVLGKSLVYVCAYRSGRLVGFVHLAWDGGLHAFVLDPTVHPGQRRRGVGRQLVRRAAVMARGRGVRWLHADFEPGLRGFYERCGFRATEAGVMPLEAGRDV